MQSNAAAAADRKSYLCSFDGEAAAPLDPTKGTAADPSSMGAEAATAAAHAGKLLLREIRHKKLLLLQLPLFAITAAVAIPVAARVAIVITATIATKFSVAVTIEMAARVEIAVTATF